MKEEDGVPLKRWRAGNSRVKPALASGTQAHSARQMGCLTLVCSGFWKTLLNQLLHQMKLTS